MPYQRESQVVLAIWHDVERELESTEQGSPEPEFLQAEVAPHRNDSAKRDMIALHVLAMLPDGWWIGQTSWNPDVRRWAVTARGPQPGRGKAQETISGTGEDDLAAITNLRIRLDERRRAKPQLSAGR